MLQKASLLEWVQALRHLPEGPIDWACRNYHTTDAGKQGFPPRPGVIYQLAVSVLPKRSAAEEERRQEEQLRLSAPPRERITPKRAAQIAKEMGAEHLFTGKIKFNRMPPAGEFAYPPVEISVDEIGPWQKERIDAETRAIVERGYTPEQMALTRRLAGIPEPHPTDDPERWEPEQ